MDKSIIPGATIRMARTVRVPIGPMNHVTLSRGSLFRVHAVDAGMVRLLVGGVGPTRIVYVKREDVA